MTTLNWKQLTSIEVGGAICLPVIMVGHQLCITYGLPSALIGILFGNLILFIMAALTVFMSVHHRSSTPENAKYYFGEQGVKFFAFLLMTAKTSWFAIQLNMMTLSIQEIFHFSVEFPLTILLGVCILAAAWKGLKALSLISSLSLPILIGTMGIALFIAEKQGDALEIEKLSMGAISVAIGAAITAVIDMPTYFRHVRSTKEGLIAVSILFLIAIPLIEMVGVYLAYQNSAATVTATLMRADLFLWNLWIMLFILIAGWTTNNTNLYSASVCLQALCKNLSEKARLLTIALLGTFLALGHVLDHLTLFLQMLGIFVGSMGAVILANYLMNGRLQIVMSFLSWVFGVLAGLLNLFHIFSLTSISILDAFLISSTIYVLGRGYEMAYCRTNG